MALCKKKIETELCVIGGGMAGLGVAITAARLGVQVTLVQERPVFGGNASGEIRMWICGAEQEYWHETGLLEELALENYRYNPTKNYNLWNALLFGKVQAEKNITPLLNCTCYDAEKDGDAIKKIIAYQMTTQTQYEITAKWFADCSGDSITAPLVGANFAWGRESQAEYGEEMRLHVDADNKTMGNSLLLQARKTNRKIPFRAPEWAEKISVEKLKSKGVNLANTYENFWYIELGGNDDVIGNAENINKRLLAVCLGVWDTIKNSGEFDADEYELEFLGFLPAKRESRRMKGDYVMTANDIMTGGKFPDTVAYGGWSLDDHNPDGFDGVKSNYNIRVEPYGIPYRCLYSENISNLFFAGRNISMTHMAMSSARVMGTCTVIGQAVGAAAYVAKKYGLKTPREVGNYIDEVQQTLLKIDCFLPNVERRVGAVGAIGGVAEFPEKANALRNGKDRGFSETENKYVAKHGEAIAYKLETPKKVGYVKLVFDSDLDRNSFGDMNYSEKQHMMRCNILDESPIMELPKTLVKRFRLELETADGKRETLLLEKENIKRSWLIPVEREVTGVSLTVEENWGGAPESALFTFELFEGGETENGKGENQ
ncbi:MAG: FAD-dependent oxidoreductase [Clostridia bacterium]|nr:FAD-dependent oxidoreductase [Clostridia bacterium]